MTYFKPAIALHCWYFRSVLQQLWQHCTTPQVSALFFLALPTLAYHRLLLKYSKSRMSYSVANSFEYGPRGTLLAKDSLQTTLNMLKRSIDGNRVKMKQFTARLDLKRPLSACICGTSVRTPRATPASCTRSLPACVWRRNHHSQSSHRCYNPANPM
jgi:hypothetical protein